MIADRFSPLGRELEAERWNADRIKGERRTTTIEYIIVNKKGPLRRGAFLFTIIYSL